MNDSDYKLLLKNFKKSWPIQSWESYGLFTEDYLLLLNPHWMQFPPPPAVNQIALGCLYVFLMILGCSGNILVIIMYARCRSLRTPGNILVVNLAMSDFLMMSKTPLFIFNAFNFGPALGKPGCVAYGFLGGLTGTTSIATLTAISMDRYWAIMRPLEPLRALTAVRARFLAVSTWIYAAIFSAIPALDIGYGRYVPEGYLTSCSFDYLTDELTPRYFIFVFFCAAWVAPLCTISFCYLKILRVVIGTRNVAIRNQEQRLSGRHMKENVKRKAEVKLAVLVIAVIALFFLSWTPYAIVALLGVCGQKEIITPLVSMIPALFCKTAACINPFIYIINHPNFRKEVKTFLSRDKSKLAMKRFSYTQSQRLSDVEIIQLKDIPCDDASVELSIDKIPTVSENVATSEDHQICRQIKNIEIENVAPPSWFVKPKFSKKSFRKKLTERVVSMDANPTK